MKKIAFLILILICFCFPALAQKQDANVYKYAAERNILILANAVELYSNDHFRDYPSEKDFYSAKFNVYIKKALGKGGKDIKSYYLSPFGEKINYKRYEKSRSFKLWLKNPERFGFKEFSFTPEKGLVKDTGKIVKGGVLVNKPEEKWDNATDSEQKEMTGIIKELYQAYKNRDLEKMMEIEKEAIVRSGMDMEKRGKYTAIEVYYAYKGTANDVFRAEGFEMEPLDLSGVHFRKKGATYQAYSSTPIIATKQVSVGTMKVRLRIGLMDFENINGTFRLVKMQLY